MNNHDTQMHLDMVYDGPALADGSMNVRDLAPAMMAVGSFFEAANRLTNGDNATVSVNVRATSPGSFHVAFEVVQVLQAVEVLGTDVGDFLTTANALKALLIGGTGLTGGLFWLIRRLRGRRPQVTRVNEGLYRLTVDDETYEVPMTLLRLYQDASVRRNIQDMVRPVKEPDIDRFMLQDAGQTVEEVTKEDVAAFDTPEYQDLILDEVNRKAFSIASLAFRENNKWRLTDGDSTFSVSMKDTEFQRKVNNNEIAFASGDILVCDLRTIQWQAERGVRSEYEVITVVAHRPARQLSFFDENEGTFGAN